MYCSIDLKFICCNLYLLLSVVLISCDFGDSNNSQQEKLESTFDTVSNKKLSINDFLKKPKRTREFSLDLDSNYKNFDPYNIGYYDSNEWEDVGPKGLVTKGNYVFVLDKLHGSIKRINIELGEVDKYIRIADFSDFIYYNNNFYLILDNFGVIITNELLDTKDSIQINFSSSMSYCRINGDSLQLFYRSSGKLSDIGVFFDILSIGKGNKFKFNSQIMDLEYLQNCYCYNLINEKVGFDTNVVISDKFGKYMLNEKIPRVDYYSNNIFLAKDTISTFKFNKDKSKIIFQIYYF